MDNPVITNTPPKPSKPKHMERVYSKEDALKIVEDSRFSPPLGLTKESVVKSIDVTETNKSTTFFGSLEMDSEIVDYIFDFTNSEKDE